MKTPPPGLVFRWMSFAEHGDRIVSLRRQVFVEEQGYGEEFIRTPYDDEGLHLGAFDGDRLISLMSIFLFDDKPEVFAKYGLPLRAGRVLQFSKRAELRAYRGARIAELLAATVGRRAYEVLRPRSTCILLQGEHSKLEAHYAKAYGFERVGTTRGPEGTEQIVMAVTSPEALRKQYFELRKQHEALCAQVGIQTPSLVKFLDSVGRGGLIPMKLFTSENLYTGPLSLRDELPRLSTQTRILFAEQKARIQAVEFPRPPARFLDVGAGPGVYLAMLSRGAQFKGYEFAGLDASKEMVAYARLNRPDMAWYHASVYETGLPDQSYDVIHANFLLIHLLCPSLALREVARLLRPGGLFYVVDVNDSTFEGPPLISDMIQAHHNVYEGDRNIMSFLPHLASEYGMTLSQTFSSLVSNTARTPEPEITPDEVHLDQIKMWGLFSFLGQREELAYCVKPAQELYFNTGPEIRVCVQTQVYRKVA